MKLIIISLIIIISFSGWYVGMIFEDEQHMLREYEMCFVEINNPQVSDPDFCFNYEKNLRTTR